LPFGLVRHHRLVRALLRGLILEPDPRTLPADAESFMFGAQLLVGPASGPGEESFDLTVCSPEWPAQQCRSGEPVNGLHHIIVGWDTYDERVLRQWLEARVQATEAESWDGIGRAASLSWQVGVRRVSPLITARQDVSAKRPVWQAQPSALCDPAGARRIHR
jgi:hypothetical protein